MTDDGNVGEIESLEDVVVMDDEVVNVVDVLDLVEDVKTRCERADDRVAAREGLDDRMLALNPVGSVEPDERRPRAGTEDDLRAPRRKLDRLPDEAHGLSRHFARPSPPRRREREPARPV